MSRGKYLGLEEARKLGKLDQFAKEHPIEDVQPQAHPEAPGRCPLRRAGVHDTERHINNKVSRGGFTAVFFVQCLVAIGCANLRLEDG